MSNEAHLLKLLSDNKDKNLSGQAIAKKLNVSRSAVWKRIEALRNSGYEIQATPNKGYRLTASPDKLLSYEIKAICHSAELIQSIVVMDKVESTNDMAFDLALQGAKEGTVVIADHQTRGKGRLGRSWHSPKGKGAYISIILKPNLSIQELPKITLTAAACVYDAVQKHVSKGVKIKWPNDILIYDKKLCGILTEMHAQADKIEFVILGIGINIHKCQSLIKEATYLDQYCPKKIHRNAFVADLLMQLNKRYKQLTQGKFKHIYETYQKSFYLKDKRVQIQTLNTLVRGKALGIDKDGALLIKTSEKGLSRIHSGDVMVKR